MSHRTLARVVRIKEIQPIDGSDNIELAYVLGWQVVIQKNTFQVGDLAIYFEIGSNLDKTRAEFAFLKGQKLKTRKIRGVLSQGLLGPMSWSGGDYPEGTDLTKELGVRKKRDWAKGEDPRWQPIPDHIPHTQEERVQNLEKLTGLIGRNVVITQKLDGCSQTVIYEKGEVTPCGRNYVLKERNKCVEHYFEVMEKYEIERKLKERVSDDLALQGETTGKNINRRWKKDEREFHLFNVWSIKEQSYLPWSKVKEIAALLEIPTVPEVYCGLYKEEWNRSALMTLAENQTHEGAVMEGIVVKTDDAAGRVSFKVVSNKYLLSH